MTRLGIRARFALLTAALVLAIAALVGTGGYLTLRHLLFTRAQGEAADQARQLVALIDVGGEGGGSAQANQVDLRDPSLTGGFTRGRLLVTIVRPDGALIQACPGKTISGPERSFRPRRGNGTLWSRRRRQSPRSALGAAVNRVG